MIDNYLKLTTTAVAHRSYFFPFNSRDPKSLTEAQIAARKVQPTGPLAIWKPTHVMLDTLRCIGHAPHYFSGFAELGEWVCANCGQRGRGAR